MSKMKSQLAMLSMLGVASGMMGSPVADKTDWREHNKPDIHPKSPGNSREYFFDYSGLITTIEKENPGWVFKCYAINEKNALRKFNNWKKNQP